jgi:hypothetical protein
MRDDTSEESLEAGVRGMNAPKKDQDTESLEIILPKHGESTARVTHGQEEDGNRRNDFGKIMVTREVQVR